jgi:hypothetical protein
MKIHTCNAATERSGLKGRFRTIPYLIGLVVVSYSVSGCGVSREEHQAVRERLVVVEHELAQIKQDVASIKHDSAQMPELKGKLDQLSAFLAMAGQSYEAARTKSIQSSCMNNMRLIDGATQQYALDNSNALVKTMAQLVGADAYIKETPVCKGGGSYTLPSSLGGKTSCSIHGSLP